MSTALALPQHEIRLIRRQMLLINVAHYLTHYMLLILPTAVLAMARPGGAFGAAYGPILALSTAMFVLYGAGSLPQGWLAARVGRHRMMLIFFVGSGAALIASGLVDSPFWLAAWLGVAGMFAAIYHPIGTAMLVEAAGDKPGRALGLNGVFGNVGVASAPLITAGLAQQFGWPVAFIVPGIVCLLFGLFWFITPALKPSASFNAKPFPAIPRALVRRAITVLLLIAMASGMVFNAFTLLLPKLMEERLAGSPDLLPLIGMAAFVVTLCGALTQFTVGRLIDKMTLKSMLMPLAMVLVPALFLLSFAQGWMVLPLSGAVAAVIFGQVTVNETMTARYVSPALRTQIYSIRFFVGFLGGAAAAPLVAFFHQRAGNLTTSVLFLAAFALITLSCAIAFPNRREELQPDLWAGVDDDGRVRAPVPAPLPVQAPAE